ncbi:MAG: 6-bladed beta-propeller [Armatimonadota bacterium]
MVRMMAAVAVVLTVSQAWAATPIPQYRVDKIWGEYGQADGLFEGPMRLNISGNTLLVSDRDNNRVQMFDLDGRFLRKFGTYGTGRDNLHNPFDADFDADNNIYIADFINGRIHKRTFWFSFLSMISSDGSAPDQLSGPRGMAVDRARRTLYVCDTYNNRISKWTLDGRHLYNFGTFGTGPGQFNTPLDVSVGTNSIYVADTENNRIQQFSLNGKFIRQWTASVPGSNLDWPPGVSTAPNGTIFVCDGDHNRVVQFTATGKFIRTFGSYGHKPGQFDMPGGVAVDDQMRVFVSDAHSNRIERFRLNHVPTRPRSVTLSATSPRDCKNITATASGSTDVNQDPITYRYRWYSSTNNTTWVPIWNRRLLPASRTVAGRYYRCRAQAWDGYDASGWVTSATVRVRPDTVPAFIAMAQQARNGSVAVTVTLAEDADVGGEIVNMAGRVVGMLPGRSVPAGTSNILANPVSSGGTRLPHGQYMLKLTARTSEGESIARVLPLSLR